MRYDFDKTVTRHNSNSYKWDSAANKNILPMWIADMDFPTAQPIIDALAARVKHGIYGYAKVPDSYFESVKGWFEKHHQFFLEKDWILYTSGVVPAISAIIKALSEPGDKVLVQEPVYNCFFSSIRNNGCEIVSNTLLYHNGKYSIDFEDLEKKASDPKVKLLLLCNPHNPVGRCWNIDELLSIGEICLRNDVIVVSDEIHCDLVYTGNKHVAFGSISTKFLHHSITCTAPSKTFNLAGLQVANIIAADQDMRIKINKALNVNEVCDISPFAVEALIAAYNQSEEWLEQLKEYLYENYIYLRDFFSAYLPLFSIMPLEATYLVWIDCSVLAKTSEEIAADLSENGQIWLNAGTFYGSAGEGFIRINIACPRSVLIEGLSRIKTAFTRSDE